MTKFSGGVTSTRFVDGLKVIFMRIILDEKNLAEPFILIGVIYDIINIRDGKNPDKFEELIRHIEYRHTKVFSDDENIEYEDALIMFKGKFFRVNLYDLNTSDQIVDKVINPAVKLYRTI